MARTTAQTKQLVVICVASVLAVSVLVWRLSKRKPGKATKNDLDDDRDDDTVPTQGSHSISTPTKKASKTSASEIEATPKRDNTTLTSADLNQKIEELDAQGKVFFQKKKFMQAAQSFTDALDLIDDNFDYSKPKEGDSIVTSILRQRITLLNNRSAMYEKAEVPELALDDCNAILAMQMDHPKARARKLRILESLQRWYEALQEVCAVQLLFMQTNRTQLRMGLPVPPPPVPQSKMEEILNHVVAIDTKKYEERLQYNNKHNRKLPGSYMILHLLRSYTGYNAWMSQAAKDGSVEKLTKELESSSAVVADKVKILLKRGRRYLYDRMYEKATIDFEEAYSLLDGCVDVIAACADTDTYARILEWTGLLRHLHNDLDSAMSCFEKAAEIEPNNALLFVKQAGVQLDFGKQAESLQLYDKALAVDPEAIDAFFHRSNLHIMQGKAELAKSDLEKCIRLRPSYTMARLRLAAILAPMEDLAGAKRQIDLAEKSEPNSSEVLSHRGELHFAQGEMDQALKYFEQAIKLDPDNPTPYVNAAMALMNTPPSAPNEMPDTAKIFSLLEKAIEMDCQFTAAYIHLGQLRLGTATELASARNVITLYDKGLENARSVEEITELCGMRALAVAQVDAASSLNMVTFNIQ